MKRKRVEEDNYPRKRQKTDHEIYGPSFHRPRERHPPPPPPRSRPNYRHPEPNMKFESRNGRNSTYTKPRENTDHRKLNHEKFMKKQLEIRNSVPLSETGQKIFSNDPYFDSKQEYIYPKLMDEIQRKDEMDRLRVLKRQRRRKKGDDDFSQREISKPPPPMLYDEDGEDEDEDREKRKVVEQEERPTGPSKYLYSTEENLIDDTLLRRFKDKEREEMEKLKNQRRIQTLKDDKVKELEKLGYVMSGNRKKFVLTPIFDEDTYALKTYIEKQKKEMDVRRKLRKLVEDQKTKRGFTSE